MNDLKYKMLGDLGYSGSLDDRRFSFYKANGAVSYDINDAEFEWLGGLGFTQTSIRDRWNAYLNTIGFGNEKSEYAVAKADNLYFSPRNMFLAGEKGVWYDPSDFSTMFQDAAGTTPVTAVGQPVGKINDKSGNGFYATQSTAASRPVLGLENGKYYLTFDGVDDWLSTAAIDFTGTDKMTVVAGVRKLSDAATGMLLELSATLGGNNGSFFLDAPDSASNRYGFATKGTAFGFAVTTSASFVAPHSAVLTGTGNIAGDTAILRINGAQVAQALVDQGTGNFGNYPLYIGRRGGTTLPFNGRLYGLVVRGAQSSNLFIDYTERYLNSRTGAF